jgi:hypothetical protein
MASAPNFAAQNVSGLAERYLAARGCFTAINDEIESLVCAVELRNPGVDYKLYATAEGASIRVGLSDGGNSDYSIMQFESLQEALDYLADSLTPTDTELLDVLDALDAAAPFGFRQGVRGGLLPINQDELNLAEFCRRHFHGQKPIRELLFDLLSKLKDGSLAKELGSCDCGCDEN